MDIHTINGIECYTVAGAALAIGIAQSTIRVQIKKGVFRPISTKWDNRNYIPVEQVRLYIEERRHPLNNGG